MTDQQNQPDLASQFKELGDNLKNIMQTAWQSEEAHKLRQDIKDGLTELGKAASDAVNQIQSRLAGAERGQISVVADDGLRGAVSSSDSEAGSLSRPSDDDYWVE